MLFKKLVVDGQDYGRFHSRNFQSSIPNQDFSDPNFFADLKLIEQKKAIENMLMSISVCHQVMIQHKDGNIELNGTSSDEISLLRFCEHVGYIPLTNTSNEKI